MARESALESIREAQKKYMYKSQYDRKTDTFEYKIGDWVYSFISTVMRQGDLENCQDHGMGHFGSHLVTRPTLWPHKSTSLAMTQ